MMQSEANLLSQHLNEQSIAEAQGHASPIDQLLLLALFHDPTIPTPRDSYPLGILGTVSPKTTETDWSMLRG